ncbi:MAG: Stp1/IreP family PP2C-type Ser/Thr phosphatase [Myxococcota bacterium]
MSNPKPIRTSTASQSHVGQVRAVNQDVCGEFSDDLGRRLLVVADGMGGHAGGETASQLALETIGEVFGVGFDDPIEMLRKALKGANAKIHQAGNADPELHNMGTTAVALLLGVGETISVAHVGDSRAYRMRAGQLEQITEDHSWVEEEVRQNRLAAEDAESHRMKNVLLRSLGVAPEVDVSVMRQPLRPGDRFMLCSDGLWGEVRPTEISEILARSDARTAVRDLIDLANRNGGSDNVTVAVAIVQNREAESTRETERPGIASNTESITLPIDASVGGDDLSTVESENARTHWPSWVGPVMAFSAGLLVVLLVWASL